MATGKHSLPVKNVLADIRKELDAHLGERIRVKANRGRNKVVERQGILEQTYNNIFVVKLDQESDSFRRVSYSYSDVLTESVEVLVRCQHGESRVHTSNR
ncbi:MAG: Veg family protein [Bacillota bacterium]